MKQLAYEIDTHTFEAGDVLVKKEDQLDSLVIIAKGSVVARDVSLGGRTYNDQIFGPEGTPSFGWQSLLSSTHHDTHQPTFMGELVAQTDGVAMTLSKSSFTRVMKSHHNSDDRLTIMEQLAERRLARIELQQIPLFQDSLLDDAQINRLVDLMHRFEYSNQTIIFNASDKVEAALYFVRQGTVTLKLNKGDNIRYIEAGDYFGENNMLRDQNKDSRKHSIFRSPMAAEAHSGTIVDVLYLEECRAVVDTTLLGLGNATDTKESNASIQWSDIKRYSLLGSGAFGQVWLSNIPTYAEKVDTTDLDEEKKSTSGESVERRIVALKVQSKYQVIDAGEAIRVVAERNILSSLNSPFLLKLYHSFQDEDLLYMITSVAQGGELETLIPDDGMCEASAKFYAAGILEGLAWMHRRHLIHRDIKPQNVLINEKGYTELIDFGFGEYKYQKEEEKVTTVTCHSSKEYFVQLHIYSQVCIYW